MATAGGFAEAGGRGSHSKRKRGDLDDAVDLGRGNSRRAFAHHHAEPATANMTDTGDHHNYLPPQNGDADAAQFDLSALQQAQANPGPGHGGPSDTAAAALTHHYSMNVPPPPGQDFMHEPGTGAEQAYMEGDSEYAGFRDDSGLGKPPVGSEQWHKVRKDNHKEVERRRRETINEGINELAKIVPGNERNKGSILARAVQYIQKLHDEASQNIDKWTFEKLITEQAIADLSAKMERAWEEKEAWKRIAKEAGVDVDNVDLGLGPDPGEQGKDVDGQDEADRDRDRGQAAQAA